MSRQGKNFISRLSAALLLTAVMAFESFAANARISFSDPSTQVGAGSNRNYEIQLNGRTAFRRHKGDSEL